MRRHEDVRRREERAVRIGRVAQVDVRRVRADLAGGEGRREIGLDDDRAARRVHEDDAVLHLRDRVLVHEAARLGRGRDVEADEVGPLEELVEVVHELGERVVRDLRVVREDLHPEGLRAAGDLGADQAGAHEAERLAEELGALELLLEEAAALEPDVPLDDSARDREHERHRELRHGDRRRARRVLDVDAALAAGLDVDVVEADAAPDHELEVRRVREVVARDLRLRADEDDVCLLEAGGVGEDLAERGEAFGKRFVERIGQQDLHVGLQPSGTPRLRPADASLYMLRTGRAAGHDEPVSGAATARVSASRARFPAPRPTPEGARRPGPPARAAPPP